MVTAGLGGMGGAQPLAATMNGAAFLGVEVNPPRIERRLQTGYLDRMTTDLDEALALVHGGEGEAGSRCRSACSATRPRCCPNWCAAASRPTC